ncbi:MAG: hypothetical protein F6J90_03010 [Moorea sp. SIOASIH]|uniref:hypothetical protein n=1 Tax=Moorena sp. SIOASIH TaxID=2607817 RepID=UPI0013BC2E66|nr:hypothetical protein [Moorena sp. SIOASIH]NEO35328.1 hypothetical protein [Moorena sp. SIOASIH]
MAHGSVCGTCVGTLKAPWEPPLAALPPREATALLPKILLYLINSCLLPLASCLSFDS